MTAGSSGALGLDRVEVAYGVAKVFPFLREDYVQARTDGFGAWRIVRVFAWRGQHVGCEGGEEVAHHRDPARPDIKHLGVRRRDRGEDRQVKAVFLGAGVPETDRVERPLGLEYGTAEP